MCCHRSAPGMSDRRGRLGRHAVDHSDGHGDGGPPRGEPGLPVLPTIAQGLVVYLNSGRLFSDSLVAPGSTIRLSPTLSAL